MHNIAIIGGGNMGEALIKGLKGQSVLVCEADAKRAAYLKKTYKVSIDARSDAAAAASTIILAVKPQDMSDALTWVKKYPKSLESKLFISIAAGLTTKFFEGQRPDQKLRVVRSMPNMPALIGEGITGICAGKFAKPADMARAKTILGALGQTVVVNESMINAVTAVSGSGPAYVFLFVEQWMAAAKSLGFNEADAKALVYQTLLGSAHLLEKSEWNAATLRAKVTSKGGTTQAAMDVFMNAKFDGLMKQALKAARDRAKELAK